MHQGCQIFHPVHFHFAPRMAQNFRLIEKFFFQQSIIQIITNGDNFFFRIIEK